MADKSLPLRFGSDGLISAVITDAGSGDILMVGYMNEEALERTRSSGHVHFWSRSRQTLWKKGESSGHLQHVREIRVNCDLNSVLIEVDQEGAVCHDGYATCYYRRLDADNSLEIVRDRQFDPGDVYPTDGNPAGLTTQTQRWWSAYEWLRDTDLADQSGTSKRLRAEGDDNTPRIADELRELAGVLDGSHRHDSIEADLKLESGQVLYWVACSGVYHQFTWDQVRPDRALDITGSDLPSTTVLMRLLTARADQISAVVSAPDPALLHDTIALVGRCLRAHDLDPLDVINGDLHELAGKPYLAGVIGIG